MARSTAEGSGDSRTYLNDPYRRETPSSTDASAGRVRTASRGGIRGTACGEKPGAGSLTYPYPLRKGN